MRRLALAYAAAVALSFAAAFALGGCVPSCPHAAPDSCGYDLTAPLPIPNPLFAEAS